MAQRQVSKSAKYSLPLERLFSIEGTDKVLDCMLSNYELKQKLEDVANFTKLQKEIVEKSLAALVKEELVKKIRDENVYITNFKSDRLAGLFTYYRATLAENLGKLEFNKVDMQ